MASTTIPHRIQRLFQALEERVLVLDGAMGTALQSRALSAADFGGPALEGCNEHLALSRPDVVSAIHEAYLQAGADIVETNSFGATPLVLAEYGLADQTHAINLAAAKLARAAADRFWNEAKPRFVAGSMGPTTKSITVTGGVSFEELIEHFAVQAQALYEGGVDYFLIETAQDTRNIKAALLGIGQALASQAHKIPVAVSVTIEATGTMLAGQDAEALAISLEHADLLYLGLNCATGPEAMTDHLRTLAGMAKTRIACVPNAGLPDEEGRYLESPEDLAAVLQRFGEAGWLNLVGGCCGTEPRHIAALQDMAARLRPRSMPLLPPRSLLSGIEALELSDDKRPILVGERSNVIGSRKFKELICSNRFEEAAEVGKAQVKQGAQILDVCLANPDRDELSDMRRFLEKVLHKVRVPFMIDSTDARVIAAALTYCQGKAVINSVNLEEGEERFAQVVPLAKKFGAALVVGTIDEDPAQGMGVTRDRKLQIARRSYRLLLEKYKFRAEDIYFDLLVFPVGTGDENYKGSAVETIEAIRQLKSEFPLCKTILGISNVSFGLPASGREVLNSVFLHHCVQAGLDLAIVNAEKLERYPSIPETEKRLAEDLLHNRGEDPIQAFAQHFRETAPRATAKKSERPLEARLAQYVIEGSKDGLREDLDLALKGHKPLDIINGPLMTGMNEVGRLFNNNELIVAEVLQSAEAMKAAVRHLEPFIEKNETSLRGKVLLATVKGDVHDIGKNLVDIILSNNGFDVVNLGIKVAPEALIAAVKEHRPDLIGLSGLLVKSAEQMALTADDLTQAGIDIPMLVGGAALSEKFTDVKIAPAYAGFVAYAHDAMKGLELARQIRNHEDFAQLKAKTAKRRQTLPSSAAAAPSAPADSAPPSARPGLLTQVPKPPDLERHSLLDTPLEEIWAFINPLMLYGRHLGVKGNLIRRLEAKNFDALAEEAGGTKAVELHHAVESLKLECLEKRLLKPRGLYRFFRAAGLGNRVLLYDADKEVGEFVFPRQKQGAQLCLADYVSPLKGQNDEPGDSLCLLVVTAGEGVRAQAEAWKHEGLYLKSHLFQALALETAEAYAEWLHAYIRNLWGFPDPPGMTMMQRFQAKYRGKRYSFGYPACPNLDDQKMLFDLLKPGDIGVSLTEGMMMDPEASVSAIVFHHPQALYFGVGQNAD